MHDQAKLGFFDFFDLHRDQPGGAPSTMLQHDGKVLVAVGHGTLDKPFTVNISSLLCSISRMAWPLRPCTA